MGEYAMNRDHRTLQRSLLAFVLLFGCEHTVDPTTPLPPNGLAATAVSATQIDLSWSDGSSDEVGFRVERAPGGTSAFVEIASLPANATNYSSTGLTASTSYTYRVCAYNGAGNSTYSNTATVSTKSVPVILQAPTGLSATAVSSSQINLSWTDASTNEDGFKVERAPGGTTNFTEIARVPRDTTSFQSTGLTASTGYSYRVRAYVSADNSAYSNTATATTLDPNVRFPAAPTTLKATAVSSYRIGLTWTDASDNEDGFKVERAMGGTTNFTQIATVSANTSAYLSVGLTPSTSYAYRVRAYNNFGNSGYSNTATAITEAAPIVPVAPTNLVAQTYGTTQINLTWSDASDNEDGFKVERAPGGTTNFAEIETVPRNTVSYQSTGLTPSSSYSYRVRAYNAGGNSGYSNTVTARTMDPITTVPAAPKYLVAIAVSSGQINLAWTDASDNEVGFKVERAPGGSENFVEIGTAPKDATTYQDAGLTATTSYSYRVVAYNATGNSEYSNTATAITPPETNQPITVYATAANTLWWTDPPSSAANNVYRTGYVGVGNIFSVTMGGANFYATALQFSDILSQISGKTISSATLKLYAWDLAIVPSPYRSAAYAGAWSPNTITANNSPDLHDSDWSYQMPPGMRGGVMELDVTQIVKKWQAGTWSNNGLYVNDPSYTWPPSDQYRLTQFESDDTYTTAAHRPQIYIVFQ